MPTTDELTTTVVYLNRLVTTLQEQLDQNRRDIAELRRAIRRYEEATSTVVRMIDVQLADHGEETSAL